MNTHKNARLTVRSRLTLVNRVLVDGMSKAEVARAMGVSYATVRKWVNRYQKGGQAALADGSSRPQRCPHRTPDNIRDQVELLRRERRTYRQISQQLEVSETTVCRILRSRGLNCLRLLEPAPPIVRYEREAPGDLIHLDIKKLGRFRQPGHRVTGNRRIDSVGAGWEYVHVTIDDHSRVAHAAIYNDETAASACDALLSAVRYYKSLGIAVKRVMTDNGSCYRSDRFRRLCRRLGAKQIYTKPYTPKTNGKAERFIQTSLRQWAYARSYDHSLHRQHHLPLWLHQYNWHRPHAGINYQTPIQRLKLNGNNLVALHS